MTPASIQANARPCQRRDEGQQAVGPKIGIGCRVVNVRNQDDIWFVSARQQNHDQQNFSQQNHCQLDLQRLVDGHWVTASIDELTNAHAVDQHRSSMVYVHGNRTNNRFAHLRGLQFYQNIFNDGSNPGPVRFVIFAWRSERERVRPTSDYNVKLERSVQLGPPFANFLNQFHDRQIVLAGFSLGGQVILSALAQLQSQAATDKAGRFQVALVTPALKADDALISVAPLPFNPVAAKTVVFVNQKDNAIRASMLVARVASQQPAVTLEQIASQPAGEMVNPVVIEDMTEEATRSHSITKYSERSSRLKSVLKEMVDLVRSSYNP